MNFTKKNKEYVDLVVPFTCCPIGEPVEDCPFISYWDIKDLAERIRPIEELSEEELDNLRAFHRKCLIEKVELARHNPDDEKLTKVNLDKLLEFF